MNPNVDRQCPVNDDSDVILAWRVYFGAHFRTRSKERMPSTWAPTGTPPTTTASNQGKGRGVISRACNFLVKGKGGTAVEQSGATRTQHTCRFISSPASNNVAAVTWWHHNDIVIHPTQFFSVDITRAQEYILDLAFQSYALKPAQRVRLNEVRRGVQVGHL